MRGDQLRSRLAAGAPVLGTWAQTPSPELIEMLGLTGFDFVVLDMEHGYFGAESLPNLIRAAELSGTAALVRVPKEAPEQVSKALDLGAPGVVIPGIGTRQEAAGFIARTRFRPAGERGASLSTRELRYSARTLPELLASGVRPLVVLQVEAVLATENLDDILRVEGVDVLFIGPFDLAASLGLPGQLQHPDVLRAIRSICDRARQRGVTVGLWTREPETAGGWIEAGIRFVTVSNNELIFFEAAQRLRRQLGRQAARAMRGGARRSAASAR